MRGIVLKTLFVACNVALFVFQLASKFLVVGNLDPLGADQHRSRSGGGFVGVLIGAVAIYGSNWTTRKLFGRFVEF